MPLGAYYFYRLPFGVFQVPTHLGQTSPFLPEGFPGFPFPVIPFLVNLRGPDVLQGAFRGVGRQRQSAQVVLVSLWLIGVPCSYVYALRLGWGLPGVLLGSITGFAVEIPLLLGDMMCRWDWRELALQASTEVVDGSPTTAEMMPMASKAGDGGRAGENGSSVKALDYGTNAA